MVTQIIEKTSGEQRLPMSYEEYLDWVGENVLAEWVDGEVIVHMPPKDEHQTILLFLSKLMGGFVDLFGLGKVQIAPFEVKLWPGGPSREPDLFFLRNENRDRLTSERLNGPPDLIVEIVSPDSVRRDRDQKYHEYAQAGVSEYWIIDSRPGRQRADFYRLNPNKRYELVATEDDRRVESTVLPGFWLDPAWLWQAEETRAFALIAQMSDEAAAALRALLDKGSS